LRAAFFLALALPLVGCLLWLMHAEAWGLGGRSPVLNYDTAQYALAARELATHGRLATTFALPIELTRHAQPPWPLAVVQPGLVLIEAALFRLTPPALRLGPTMFVPLSRPDQREWLVLVAPFCCFILIGLLLTIITSRVFRRYASWLPEGRRLAAALTVGFAFYLDPEAQHFASGGFTELPFTLGLLLCFAALAFGIAPRRPFLFGLLMGVTGSLRANMLWLAPLLALAAAAIPAPSTGRAPRGGPLRVLVLALAGFAVPLAPWWLYKWRAFGSPAWDLTRFVIWDHVQGRSWFSLYHLPEEPVLPTGLEAAQLLAAKAWSNLRPLLLSVSTGTRALWLGAIVVWLMMVWPWRRAAGYPPDATPAPAGAANDQLPAADLRPLAVTTIAAVVALAISLLIATVSLPWLRFVFPTRILAEVTGIIALWGVVTLASDLVSLPALKRGLYIAVGMVVLGWGLFQTTRGNVEARRTSAERGVPNVLSMLQITVLLNREVPAGEVVMSNLGPLLAWTSRRPVLHLASSPGDLEACRRRLEFRRVLLVFRNPESAWAEWHDVVARPAEARSRPEWNIRSVREWLTSDGFRVIWLDLGPPRPWLAALPARPE